MRGRSKNLRTLSFSTHSVLAKKLFGSNFYHKMWPLSLFFGFLPVYRSLWITRHDSKPAQDTVQHLSYHLQKKIRPIPCILWLPTSAQNSFSLKSRRWVFIYKFGFQFPGNFEKKWENLGYFWDKKEDFGFYLEKCFFFSGKGRLEGTMGKFCDFISEKGRLEGTSEIFEKNKVQQEKWPVPSNGPLYLWSSPNNS